MLHRIIILDICGIKYFKALIFSSNDVGGKQRTVRAILWFQHLFVSRKLTGMWFLRDNMLHNYAESKVEASQCSRVLLRFDRKKFPLGSQGLSDLLKGTSSRFSQPEDVGELVTFPLTTCPAVPKANAALYITDTSPPVFLLQAECVTTCSEGAQGRDWVMTHKKITQIKQPNRMFGLDVICVNMSFCWLVRGKMWCNKMTMMLGVCVCVRRLIQYNI